MGRVADKVALVTGGASNPGLGRTTALRLAEEGAKLVVTDVDINGAEACAQAIKDAGGDAIALHHDVANAQDWDKVSAAINEHFGRLDILVNNAGIEVLVPIEEMSLDQWNRQIEVNLTSVFLGCKTGIAMMKTHGGSIINLSSVAGIVGLERCVAYGASKGGVRTMSKAVAKETAKYNIRCNSVHPGIIWTNMQARSAGTNDVESYEVPTSRVPLGRAGEPLDIANCVLYLASDESKYVTAAEFVVDAGMIS